MNNKFAFALSALTLLAAAAPATAQSAGDIRVRVAGTMVDPDGGIEDVELDAIGLPAGTDTRADTNYVPTTAVEYFVSPNISFETICCVTQHDVVGTGPLAGTGLVSNANIVPATLTVRYHPLPGAPVSPYVGVGPTYFVFIDERPGATTRALVRGHYRSAAYPARAGPLGRQRRAELSLLNPVAERPDWAARLGCAAPFLSVSGGERVERRPVLNDDFTA